VDIFTTTTNTDLLTQIYNLVGVPVAAPVPEPPPGRSWVPVCSALSSSGKGSRTAPIHPRGARRDKGCGRGLHRRRACFETRPQLKAGAGASSAPQSLQMYPDNPDQRSLPRRRPGSMPRLHERPRTHKSLRTREKFELVRKMGPGLRRESDQKNASIPIPSQPQSMRVCLIALKMSSSSDDAR
jgi:hypothetical protein